MLDFLQGLIETGRVTVPLVAEAEPSSQLDLLIQQIDKDSRLEFAFTPPALSMPAAMWALSFIENACRFLVYRELDETIIAARLELNYPEPSSPSRAYSVDLFMRYLPDVTRMAKGVGESDPLVKHLHRAAASWPLSSVGVPDVICESAEVDVILSDRALCMQYVDRIIQRHDTSRLDRPVIRDAIQTAIGAYPSLALEMSRAIEKYQEPK